MSPFNFKVTKSINSVQSPSGVQFSVTPWVAARQAFLFITISRSSLTQETTPWSQTPGLRNHESTSFYGLSHPVWGSLLQMNTHVYTHTNTRTHTHAYTQRAPPPLHLLSDCREIWNSEDGYNLRKSSKRKKDTTGSDYCLLSRIQTPLP